MRYVLFLLFIMISGCVLNQPNNFTYYTEVHSSNVSNVSSTSPTPAKETPVVPKVTIIDRTTKSQSNSCPPFILPSAGVQPVAPVFTQLPPMIKPGDDDVVLTDYIKEMRKFVNQERTKVEKAYREWQQSCK